MSVFLQWKPGTRDLRSVWWYGRIELGGKQKTRNLEIRVRGCPPASGSLRDKGDEAFEASRNEAVRELDKMREAARRKRSAEELVQDLHEMRTGRRIESLALRDVTTVWSNLPHKRPLAENYKKQVVSLFKRFIEYLYSEFPAAKEMADVTAPMADGFMAAERARGASPRTCNNSLVVLRSIFKKLARRGGITRNPFGEIPTETEQTSHRVPFTVDELPGLIAAAKNDAFIGPIVIVALTTAMRQGDCCCLKWEHVDLDANVVKVKTAKTQARVGIPIFPLLRETILSSGVKGKPSDYVFPDQAAMHKANKTGITWRLKALLKRLGYSGDNHSPGEAGAIQQTRDRGLRAASIRGMHSFRVTWITIALMGGMPVEVVQMVTGHKTVQTVLEHYFRPKDSQLREAMEAKLPSLLLTGAKSSTKTAKERVAELIARLDEKSAAKVERYLQRLIFAN